MADRKQGAGLSSGSSAAVHKANCGQWHPVHKPGFKRFLLKLNYFL